LKGPFEVDSQPRLQVQIQIQILPAILILGSWSKVSVSERTGFGEWSGGLAGNCLQLKWIGVDGMLIVTPIRLGQGLTARLP